MSNAGIAHRHRPSELQPLMTIDCSLELVAELIADQIGVCYTHRPYWRHNVRPDRGCCVFIDPNLAVYVLPDTHELADLWMVTRRSWWLGTYTANAVDAIAEDLRDLIG